MAQGGLPDVGDLDLDSLLATLQEQPRPQAPFQQQLPQAPCQQQQPQAMYQQQPQQQQFQNFLLFQQFQQTMGFQQQPSFQYQVQVPLPPDLSVLQDLATTSLPASIAPPAFPDPPAYLPPASLPLPPSSALPIPATNSEEAPAPVEEESGQIATARFQPLKPKEVLSILALGESRATNKIPWKPQPGTVYLYLCGDLASREDWRATGWRMGQVKGITFLGPKEGEEGKERGCISKREFNADDGSRRPNGNFKGHPGFKMFSWTVTSSNPNLMVLQFIGDTNVIMAASSRPHGNAKSVQAKSVPFVRTAPSTIRNLESSKKQPLATYKEAVDNCKQYDPGHQKRFCPRDKEQVRNTQKNYLRLMDDRDEFYALHKFTLDYPGNLGLLTSPDLLCVNMVPEMEEQVRQILRLDFDSLTTKPLFGYDTQFNMGNYYLSWLIVADPRFVKKTSGAPLLLPVAQFLHERKYAFHHNLGFQMLLKQIPELGYAKFLGVSDSEFTSLLDNVFSGAYIFKCENHAISMIEFWVARHGGKKDDKTVYKTDFRYLIRRKDKEDYLEELKSVSLRWEANYHQYFMDHIHPDIERFSLWKALEWGAPVTEDSVITSNNCENINNQAKDMQGGRKVRLDEAAKLGRMLCLAKLKEIGRAYMGCGDYVLRPEFRSNRDDKTGQALLEQLGDVATYRQIQYRSRCEHDLTRHSGAGHRTVKPAELTEPRGEEQVVTEEVVATEEVAVEDTSMELDQDLDRLLSQLQPTVSDPSKKSQDSGPMQAESESTSLTSDVEEVELQEDMEPVFSPLPTSPADWSPLPLYSSPVLAASSPLRIESPEQEQESLPEKARSNKRRSASEGDPGLTLISDPDNFYPGMVYVKSLETCLLPGQNKKIVIEPRNNYCSVHGHVSKQRWCNHLMAAGQMMGMKLPVRKPYERRLKDLRANQRFDKKQSGGKAPRQFDLIPVREVLDMEALEARQLAMDSDPRVTGTREGDTANTIDQVLDLVVAGRDSQALEEERRRNSFSLFLEDSPPPSRQETPAYPELEELPDIPSAPEVTAPAPPKRGRGRPRGAKGGRTRGGGVKRASSPSSASSETPPPAQRTRRKLTLID